MKDEGCAIEPRIRASRLAGDVPTEKDLASSRACSYDARRSLRSAWRGGGACDPGGFGDCDRSMGEADEVGARLRREPDRVAEQATLMGRKSRVDDLLRRAQDTAESIRARKIALQQE